MSTFESDVTGQGTLRHLLVQSRDIGGEAVAREGLPHHVAPRGTPGGVVDQVLEAHGLARRTAVIVPSFLVVAHLLASTDLVATLPERVAVVAAGQRNLVVREHPLDLPGFTLSMIWHERREDDPGQQWLRRALVEVASTAGADG